MDIFTKSLQFSTKGFTDIINLTDDIQILVNESKIKEGQVHIFGIGSTTGITTVEYEPGLVHSDLAETFENIAPYKKIYVHNNTWGDDNGAAHIRSSLVGTSLNVPLNKGKMILGTWQQIIFIDFDTKPRERNVVVQIIGNK